MLLCALGIQCVGTLHELKAQTILPWWQLTTDIHHTWTYSLARVIGATVWQQRQVICRCCYLLPDSRSVTVPILKSLVTSPNLYSGYSNGDSTCQIRQWSVHAICTFPAQHMVCWTTVQLTHMWQAASARPLQLAWLTVPVQPHLMTFQCGCIQAMSLLLHALVILTHKLSMQWVYIYYRSSRIQVYSRASIPL